MTVSDKIKTIDNKIEAQYELDKETAKISVLSSGNLIKYEFLTDNDVFLEKYLLEKASTMERFENLTLDKELKGETDIAKKTVSKIR